MSDADDYIHIGNSKYQVHAKYQYCSLKAHRSLILISSENITIRSQENIVHEDRGEEGYKSPVERYSQRRHK